jgi:hypothetical protein
MPLFTQLLRRKVFSATHMQVSKQPGPTGALEPLRESPSTNTCYYKFVTLLDKGAQECTQKEFGKHPDTKGTSHLGQRQLHLGRAFGQQSAKAQFSSVCIVVLHIVVSASGSVKPLSSLQDPVNFDRSVLILLTFIAPLLAGKARRRSSPHSSDCLDET